MLDDLEERIRRLEVSMRSSDDVAWPDSSSLPEPLPWPDHAERDDPAARLPYRPPTDDH